MFIVFRIVFTNIILIFRYIYFIILNLYVRDFKDNKNYSTLQKARSSYFRQNGFNIDYQIVGKNEVWKPKPSDFVSYSDGYDFYSYIVISIKTNNKGRVISADIILKTGIHPALIFASSKGIPAKDQTYMIPGVHPPPSYKDPSRCIPFLS